MRKDIHIQSKVLALLPDRAAFRAPDAFAHHDYSGAGLIRHSIFLEEKKGSMDLSTVLFKLKARPLWHGLPPWSLPLLALLMALLGMYRGNSFSLLQDVYALPSDQFFSDVNSQISPTLPILVIGDDHLNRGLFASRAEYDLAPRHLYYLAAPLTTPTMHDSFRCTISSIAREIKTPYVALWGISLPPSQMGSVVRLRYAKGTLLELTSYAC